MLGQTETHSDLLSAWIEEGSSRIASHCTVRVTILHAQSLPKQSSSIAGECWHHQGDRPAEEDTRGDSTRGIAYT